AFDASAHASANANDAAAPTRRTPNARLVMRSLRENLRSALRSILFLDREALEEAVAVPRRLRRVVRDALQQRHDHPVERRRGLQVHGLIQIVVRLVIDVAHPVPADRFFGRAEFVSELERERGHAALDEAVLIAADEPVLLRFAIRLDLDALRLRRL